MSLAMKKWIEIILWIVLGIILVGFFLMKPQPIEGAENHRSCIVCIPKRPAEIKSATPELKIEWRCERLDKAFKAGAKLPFIRSATEFEQIKPKGLSKQEEAALKAAVVRDKKAVKK